MEEEKGTKQEEVVTDGDAGQQESVSTDREQEGMKSAYLAEKEKRQALENENRLLQEQMQLVAAQRTQPEPQAQQPSSVHQQAVKELGLDGVQWLDAQQTAQLEARKEQIQNERNMRMLTQITSSQFIASHPDYVDVVGSVHPSTGRFMPSKELSEILKDEPYLNAALTSPEVAYNVVMKRRKAAEKDKKFAAMEEHQSQRELDDSLKPLSPSSVGGSGGVTEGVITKSSTPDDVAEITRRIQAGEFG